MSPGLHLELLTGGFPGEPTGPTPLIEEEELILLGQGCDSLRVPEEWRLCTYLDYFAVVLLRAALLPRKSLNACEKIFSHS